MKIHYFQRYHSKENVDTANTMLLFSRLYSYSASIFFKFLKSYILPENAEPEMEYVLQEKCADCIPNATISQKSFKIAIETKLYGQFSAIQLENHLESFDNEEYKVLMTLDPKPMNAKVKKEHGLVGHVQLASTPARYKSVAKVCLSQCGVMPGIKRGSLPCFISSDSFLFAASLFFIPPNPYFTFRSER